MDAKKQAALEAAGYRVGDAEDFLEMSEPERQVLELRMKIARQLKDRRLNQGLTQKEVAARLNSTQPRVAKIEACAPDVTLDQMLRGFFSVGGDLGELVMESKKTPSTTKKKAL